MHHATAPVRCLIADDHPLTRAGIRVALEGRGFTVCAEVADADEAVAVAERELPDICLLDVIMPGNGIRAAERITELVPGTTVVMLTAADDDETLFACLRAGAVGFLPKNMSLDRLPEALHGALLGEAAIPRQVTARILSEFQRRRAPVTSDSRRTLRSLTSRESDVLQLLGEGMGTAEIARRLYLSQATVRTHLASVMRKFGVRDRSALREVLDADGTRDRRVNSH
jgi:two-component system, NarL family, nitrate/nitrite response regulator NarL